MKKMMFLMVCGLAAVSLAAKEYRIPIQNKLDVNVTLDDWKDGWETDHGLEPNFPLKIKAGQTKTLIVDVPSSYIEDRGTELPPFTNIKPNFARQQQIDCETTRKAVLTKEGTDEDYVIRVYSK